MNLTSDVYDLIIMLLYYSMVASKFYGYYLLTLISVPLLGVANNTLNTVSNSMFELCKLFVLD